MRHNGIYLARPDNEEAQQALRDHRGKRRRSSGDDLLVYCSLGIVWAMIGTGVMRIVLLSVAFVLAVALGLVQLRKYRRKAKFARLVEAGEIIHVDHHLLDVWDELRKEENVQLAASERAAQILLLFSAAEDLQPDLKAWRECLNEPELAQRKLDAEARIRVRLRRDVIILRDLLKMRESWAIKTAAAQDWATDKEVNEQLEILQRRQQLEQGGMSDQHGDAAADDGSAVDDAAIQKQATPKKTG